MRPSLKGWLYLTHRWLGIVLCLFLAMWFFSGVVMMYVGYPKLTDAQRMQHLPSLTASPQWLSPADAFARAGGADAQGDLRELSLSRSRAGLPVYHALFTNGARRVVDATTGQIGGPATREIALESAQVFVGSHVGLRYGDTVNEDAFTHSRALDRHRPLHRIAVDDDADTRLYVSSTTGEVVRQATRLERGWNYLGAWIHWLYPFRGNVFDPQWANIVNWISIVGMVLAITGSVVGVMRWRFSRPYKNGARSPYSGRMMRWHHQFGLLFAFITLTWLFSGLMSMGPWGFLRSAGPPLNLASLQGPPLAIAELTTPPSVLIGGTADVREVLWARRLNQAVVLKHGPSGAPAVADAKLGSPLLFQPKDIVTGASQLLDASVKSAVLTDYDFYYYDRAPHTMTGGRDRPLPILRAMFDDERSTWVHIDLTTAEILGRTDQNGRLRRTLFQLLHSWDWLPLLNHRPLWDVIMVILSAGGLMLSLTGIVIGWRRIGRKFKASKHR